MPNLVVCYISVALNINFKTERVLKDTEICKKCKFKGPGLSLKVNCVFSNDPSQHISQCFTELSKLRLFIER